MLMKAIKVFHSQPIYGLANTQTIPISVFQLTGYQMQSLRCNRLCCTQASFLEATLALPLEVMLEEWKIPLTKCHMVITDNGANMVNGIDISIPLMELIYQGVPAFFIRYNLLSRMESCHSGVFLT